MKRTLLTLTVLLAAGAAGLWWYGYRVSWEGGPQLAREQAANAPAGRRGRRGGDPETPVPVVAAKAERRDVPIYLDGLGTVQAFNLVQIRAMVDGPLVEVRFKEGEDVKAGDVLARIDPRPFQATLDSATAKKQQDQANLANARIDAARYAKLAATAYTSAQQSDTARAQVAQLEAQVRGDQAQIDTAQTQLGYATITAPFSGRLGVRQLDLGNIVRPGDATPLVTLTQLQPISVVFTLPQQSLAAVSAAMTAGAPEVLALQGSASNQVIDRGTLAVLDNQVDSATGTIKLKATFPNANLRLWPGGFVNVRMLVETQREVVTVPAPAVQRGPRGPYVFAIQPDNGVKRQPVTLGYEDQQAIVVTEGLEPGQLVVTDGASRLSETSKVAIAGPDGNAPDAVPLRDRTAPGTASSRTRSAS